MVNLDWRHLRGSSREAAQEYSLGASAPGTLIATNLFPSREAA
jgi:hypothetical protein